MTTKRFAETKTQLVKAEAHRLGFTHVGIAKARRLTEEADHLEAWLNAGFQGKMGYLENYFEERLDPRRLVEGAKSVVSLLYNYHNPQQQTQPDAPKLAQYAYGHDYHDVIKNKLRQLLQTLTQQIGPINGRVFVDSAPVLERAWAALSGTGWVGKHGLLINKQAGSYFFLAELITDLDLIADAPVKNYCGTCTRCIDACPTQAILPNKVLNASACISYLTIELRDAIPAEFAGKMDNWMFGCDVCQMVCPWNRFATPHNEPAFNPNPDLLQLTKQEWVELTETVFGQLFKKSAVKRTKFSGLKRNIAFLNTNNKASKE